MNEEKEALPGDVIALLKTAEQEWFRVQAASEALGQVVDALKAGTHPRLGYGVEKALRIHKIHPQGHILQTHIQHLRKFLGKEPDPKADVGVDLGKEIDRAVVTVVSPGKVEIDGNEAKEAVLLKDMSEIVKKNIETRIWYVLVDRLKEHVGGSVDAPVAKEESPLLGDGREDALFEEEVRKRARAGIWLEMTDKGFEERISAVVGMPPLLGEDSVKNPDKEKADEK